MSKMTDSANNSLKDGLANSSEEDRVQASGNLTSRESLVRRLKRSLDARTKFVDSHINKTLAFQIRSLRGGASQQEMMEKLGMNQNAISRLENPYYGKATLTTLKRIAAAHDVGLLVEFVPFSRLIDRASGTPHLDPGLGPSTMNVRSFEEELPELESPEMQSSAEAVQWLKEVFQGVAAELRRSTLREYTETAEFWAMESPVPPGPIPQPESTLVIGLSKIGPIEPRSHRSTNRKFKREKKGGRRYGGSIWRGTTTSADRLVQAR